MNKCLCKKIDKKKHFIHFYGKIRSGTKISKKKTKIFSCKTCKAIFLDKKSQLNQDDYFNSNYRNLIIHGKTIDGYLKRYEKLNELYFNELSLIKKKKLVVADVGCGVGVFLNKFLDSNTTIAIEPNLIFDKYLKNKFDYKYNYLKNFSDNSKLKIDLLFSFHVIEHLENPLNFLNEIYKVLKKGATAFIITPNDNEILNHNIPRFKEFYYRTVHNWYFNKDSMQNLVSLSKFKKYTILSKHFRGLDNYLYWIKNNKPYLKKEMIYNKSMTDINWKTFLEKNFMGENLLTILKK